MFQKKNQEELAKLNYEELTAHRKELMVRKAELLQAKKASGINPEEQTELEDLTVYLVGVEKIYKAAKPAESAKLAEPAQPSFVPAKDEENTAILLLSKGRRFNPETGEREAPVFEQKFNSSEYRLFMDNYKRLGYFIEKVVYNPFEK